MAGKWHNKHRRPKTVPQPDPWDDAGRAALALALEMGAECQAAGYRLKAAVRGFSPLRSVVLTLTRGRGKTGGASRTVGEWFVLDQSWSRVGTPAVPCPDADAARELIRGAVADGRVEFLRGVKKVVADNPEEAAVSRTRRYAISRRHGASNNYLKEPRP